MKQKKYILQEQDIPRAWYNILAEMKNKPLPMQNPKTKQPLKEEDLYPLFSKAASQQELDLHRLSGHSVSKKPSTPRLTYISKTKVSARLARTSSIRPLRRPITAKKKELPT